ncbi:FGGY carbohydrate kinase domain-containing protein isoform X3 [Takifugu flavidus]|uniref:FGGY carbohydrate kinase domain-containing protein isoform X3 n=1 Tax=Takifugu flavidus TaxID=433684 RepID=UPI002544A8F9|nr:FGGY carbohydrate kinase domain-containing protein isoform X3 [Takifugu flavidus]
MGEVYYVGVDVGTASVRAALVSRSGQLKSIAQEPISIWEPQADHYVQSSTEIWEKCCTVVKRVVRGVDRSRVRGVGFDATCSLVVLDQSFQPVSVTQDGDRHKNVVMWMDHRAEGQAARITQTSHGVLNRVGGVMSPELQPPKLLWLKENLKESCWNTAAHFFDLPDFLSWKATGSLTRSLCTLVCKWTYCPPEGWDPSFWISIGLEDLVENNFSKIGSVTCPPGTPVGDGLTQEAAAGLGLNVGTAVGASLIDAHAGGLGVLGADVKGFNLPCEDQPITARMAMICGTSTCHMAISQQPLFVPGVWGPCLSAMVPGMWLNEGGQSATGRLIDHMVQNHPAHNQVQAQAQQRFPFPGDHTYSYLNNHLRSMAGSLSAVDLLGSSLHVWPDFHGNRSPLADPTLKGMVTGLSLSQSLDDLALLYLATVQALAVSHCFTRYTAEGDLRRPQTVAAVATLASRDRIRLLSSALDSARHSSHSGGDERGGSRHQNSLLLWRFEQKSPVCPDPRQRYRAACGAARPDGGCVAGRSGSGCMRVAGLQQHTDAATT